jgi:hypothetical protein
MWKEKKGKDGKTYYYNVITRKIHPYLRGGGLLNTRRDVHEKHPYLRGGGLLNTRRDVHEKHPYLRGGGLTFSRLMYPRRVGSGDEPDEEPNEEPNEEPQLLEEAEDERDNLICNISAMLISDQPVSIGSIAGANRPTYSESAIREWFRIRRNRGPLECPMTTQRVSGVFTPEPDRIRDTARFVERILNTRYQGPGWDELRVQCAGYLELIRENGNVVALAAQEEAKIYETDRRERERARAEAGGDAPAIAFAIEEQEVREGRVIALERAIEAHAEAEAVPEECPICMDDMVGQVSVLECRHYLHTECSQNLIRSATGVPLCPLCRTVIRVIPPAIADAPAPQVRVIAPVEAREPGLILEDRLRIEALRERAAQQQQAERERLAARTRETGWQVFHEDDPGVPVAREPSWEEWPVPLGEPIRRASPPRPDPVPIRRASPPRPDPVPIEAYHARLLREARDRRRALPPRPAPVPIRRASPPRPAPRPAPVPIVGYYAQLQEARNRGDYEEERRLRDYYGLREGSAGLLAWERGAAERERALTAANEERRRAREAHERAIARARRAEEEAEARRLAAAETAAREERVRAEAEARREEIARARRAQEEAEAEARRLAAAETAAREERARAEAEARREERVRAEAEARREERVRARRAEEEAERARALEAAAETAAREERVRAEAEARREERVRARREERVRARREERVRARRAEERVRARRAEEEAERARALEAAAETAAREERVRAEAEARREGALRAQEAEARRLAAAETAAAREERALRAQEAEERVRRAEEERRRDLWFQAMRIVPENPAAETAAALRAREETARAETEARRAEEEAEARRLAEQEASRQERLRPVPTWTAGGWIIVGGEWVEPIYGWLSVDNPGGLPYQHPAPTLAPPSEPGDWFWYIDRWERVDGEVRRRAYALETAARAEPQGLPGPRVNWTAGGWRFVNREWVPPVNGWMSVDNPQGVHYEHPAPTLAPPFQPGDWYWYIDRHGGRHRWERLERPRLFGRAAPALPLLVPALPPGDEACRRLGGQDEACRRLGGQGAAMATMRESLRASLLVPSGRPNWFQGLPGTIVNWTAGGWMFVNGEWVEPVNGWWGRRNPGGVHYPYPAPTQPPPSIYPSVGPEQDGQWVWNNHTMNWQRLVEPSPSPDWPNWWQGSPGVNWTAGGWMFMGGEWVQPIYGWMSVDNPQGVHYEHPAPTLAPPFEPGDWFWNVDGYRWQQLERRGRRGRRRR